MIVYFIFVVNFQCKKTLFFLLLYRQNQHTKTTHSVDFIDQIQQNEIEGKLKSTFFVENEDNYEIKDVVWPTIGEFNETVGSQKIDDFIKNVRNLLIQAQIKIDNKNIYI